MKSAKVRSFFNAAGLALVLAVNYLANALPLNGKTTGQLSDQYNVLYTPAGYVFSIWGLIYTLLSVWVIYQLFPKNCDKPVFRRIGYWFVLNCLFNSAWIFAWHYEQVGLSLLIMFGLLSTLIVIYKKITETKETSAFIRIPFSIYIGWVSVATIVNTGVFLVSHNWNGWGLSHVTWTVIMLIVGTVLAFYFTSKNKDIFYSLVFVWAFIGIAIKRAELQDIWLSALLVAGVLAIHVIYRLLFNKTTSYNQRTQ
ncbi:tryptophan-rich sensory protein [Fictibacillus fluitans]|uniref:Tryptophan-rich sensory protein n=1 Tax=Fictibacillus fluitans TaxID=3058422 RepID=A0ABT8HUE4_9BACL|nr:tryptophan-rich sensory protein [Fictibacillus sp. NE201]MDN4524388.1 tryptophan-rich sensory protein [Fictibacillus sp. NE201]